MAGHHLNSYQVDQLINENSPQEIFYSQINPISMAAKIAVQVKVQIKI
jgi:hypothetical protein